MDPFSIRMPKPVLLHPNFCLLFAAYLEEDDGKDDGVSNILQSICFLTQLLHSNSVKRCQKDSEGNLRQQQCRETPIASCS